MRTLSRVGLPRREAAYECPIPNPRNSARSPRVVIDSTERDGPRLHRRVAIRHDVILEPLNGDGWTSAEPKLCAPSPGCVRSDYRIAVNGETTGGHREVK